MDANTMAYFGGRSAGALKEQGSYARIFQA
jgi:hypothetical protein